MVPVEVPEKELDQLDKMVNDIVGKIEQIEDKLSRQAAVMSVITAILQRLTMSKAQRVAILELAKFDLLGVRR